MKKTVKSAAALMLASILAVLILMAGTVSADADTEYVMTDNVTAEMDLAGNDELFAGYVEKLFNGEQNAELFGESAREMLSETEKKLYDFLKAKIESVAKGELESTVFVLDPELLEEWGVKTTWTNTELGVDSIDDINQPFTLFWEQFDVLKVVNALLNDCPYDLYWFDKTAGTSRGGGVNRTSKRVGSSTVYTSAAVHSLKFSFKVVKKYQSDSYSSSAPSVNTAVTGAATAAAANAQAVVAKYALLSDYSKLKAYKDEICELVSYNRDAVSSSYTEGYGDPWQIIYVFDGDESTNVVCEGYAKAFQYLCDLSEFENENVKCYTVTGEMAGGTGSGGHMWNNVTMDDGKNYLIDVTNSDSGTIGSKGGLFLSGVDGSVADGYTFYIGSLGIKFIYDDNATELWGTGADSILNLADISYEPPAVTVEITSSEDFVYNGKEHISVTVTDIDGNVLTEGINYTISYSKGGESVAAPIDAGTYTVKITVGEALIEKTVTIQPKQIRVRKLCIHNKTYDGNADIEISDIVFAYSDGFTLVDMLLAEKEDYTYTTTLTDANAGHKDFNIIFTLINSNYEFIDDEEAFTVAASVDINQAEPVIELIEDAVNLEYTGSTVEISAPTVTLVNNEVFEGEIKYSYMKDGDSEYTDGLPTDAGSYVIKAGIAASENYSAAENVFMVLNILPKLIDNARLELLQNAFVYDGTAKTPEVKIMDGTLEIPASEYTVSYTDNTEVGTATVTAVDNIGGNYIVSGSAQFSIVASDSAEYIDALGELANSLTIEKLYSENNDVVLKITAANGTELPRLILFTAVYDENGAVKDVKLYPCAEENGEIIAAIEKPDTTDSYKIMLWTDGFIPITTAIDNTATGFFK